MGGFCNALPSRTRSPQMLPDIRNDFFVNRKHPAIVYLYISVKKYITYLYFTCICTRLQNKIEIKYLS